MRCATEPGTRKSLQFHQLFNNLHFIIGKASFSDSQLVQNYAAAVEEVLRLKPSAAKGRYIKKITVSSTMGPGFQVDTQRAQALAEKSR